MKNKMTNIWCPEQSLVGIKFFSLIQTNGIWGTQYDSLDLSKPLRSSVYANFCNRYYEDIKIDLKYKVYYKVIIFSEIDFLFECSSITEVYASVIHLWMSTLMNMLTTKISITFYVKYWIMVYTQSI